MKHTLLFLSIIMVLFTCSCKNSENSSDSDIKRGMVIKISPDYNKYFVTAAGDTWIPISTNFLPADNLGGDDDIDETNFIENYFKNFSANGGNSLRIWISTSYLEIEDTQEGVYSTSKFNRIDKLLELAEKYNVLIKFTLHHIRTISPNSTPSNNWSNSKSLATKFANINEYVNTPAGRRSYLNRAKALSERYKTNRQIFSWELWNEMNAVTWDDWEDFTQQMLDSVKVLFPNHLVTQTLGSLDCPKAESVYRKMFKYNNNEYVSLHRYLDPGDSWGQYDQVKGDIDTLASTLMDFAKTYITDRPIIYNEVGAVQESHAGPSLLYPLDKEGILIHDMIFAPFFCGAAGSGSMWHWDHYILKNNLFYHYNRFSRAIKGIDPVKEQFESFKFTSNGVRCYGLKGKTQTIIWCRDTSNNWDTELLQGIAPFPKTDLSFTLSDAIGATYKKVKFYNPWTDMWSQEERVNDQINVPSFTRTIIVVLQ